METIYKANFIHPEYGIPTVATYEVEGSVVLFDYQNYDEAVTNYPKEKVDAFQKWLLGSGFNCDSLDHAINELAFMGITAEFIESSED